MFLQPVLVVLKPLLILVSLVFASIAFALDHHLDCLVDNLRFALHPFSDVFPTDGAVLLTNETLLNALLTERVATDGSPTLDYKLHADTTVQAIHLAHGLFNSCHTKLVN